MQFMEVLINSFKEVALHHGKFELCLCLYAVADFWTLCRFVDSHFVALKSKCEKSFNKWWPNPFHTIWSKEFFEKFNQILIFCEFCLQKLVASCEKPRFSLEEIRPTLSIYNDRPGQPWFVLKKLPNFVYLFIIIQFSYLTSRNFTIKHSHELFLTWTINLFGSQFKNSYKRLFL